MTNFVQLTGEEACSISATFLGRRDERINAEREGMIAEAMKHTRWQRLLRRPARTREEAIAWLQRPSFDYLSPSAWDRVEWRVGDWARRAESILSAAVNSPDAAHYIDADFLQYMRERS